MKTDFVGPCVPVLFWQNILCGSMCSCSLGHRSQIDEINEV